jgi:UDP:flavonoid glycosyltransferase YjiC (YdhE family)
MEPAAPARRMTRAARNGTKRALFVPSNGVGLGHVTRLLAVARRMPAEIRTEFFSLSQAAKIIASFGFAAEYVPSQKDVGAKESVWDDWFRHELGRKIDRTDADVVVYDGNHLTDGLVDAVMAHGKARLVWVRRGMAAQKPSRYLDNARFCDLIIEPGEIAGELDTGPTAARRDEAILVDPVRLLDKGELLSRAQARRALGFGRTEPAVLVQLGAGANRDVLGLIDEIVEHLKRFDGLQIVLAEWGNGIYNLPRWPNTRTLRGYPISRYFNAFDFSIAASGYNTYHEVQSFGLPTIFIPNRHPSMDDQGARAEFAQDFGAGFDLPDNQLLHLRALCEAMMNEDARNLVRQNCLMLARRNGARAAATEIARLVR